MLIEWDENKNKINLKDHGIDFNEAQEIFKDPLQISKLDYRFSYFEERWISLGCTKKYKLIVVANLFFNDDGEEIIRIISAREANNKEKEIYEKF